MIDCLTLSETLFFVFNHAVGRIKGKDEEHSFHVRHFSREFVSYYYLGSELKKIEPREATGSLLKQFPAQKIYSVALQDHMGW